MTGRIATALTIAGSDSSGGAGIQADLKTFTAFGVYGTSVVTVVTAQNTREVTGLWTPEPESVYRQIEAVMSDIGADAAKTGMLPDQSVIEAVVRGLDRWPIEKLVVDPVMVATSGGRLMEEEAVGCFIDLILPKACLLTPNLHEAEVLCGRTVRDEGGMKDAAEALHAMGARAVLIKGGHLDDPKACNDILFDGKRMERLEGRRLDVSTTHGSGCTFSAAATAMLAKGSELLEAVQAAKRYTAGCIEHAKEIGSGAKTLDHGIGPVEPGD